MEILSLPGLTVPLEVNGLLSVSPLDKRTAAAMVVQHHYLHRKPPLSFAFGLHLGSRVLGVVTFGSPASRHLQLSACPSDPGLVLELNRLWVHDDCPRNTESWFVSRALRALPPRIVVSYADTGYGYVGYVYRALNFHYAGWTDMERKTPRYDYVVVGKHTRDAFRDGTPQWDYRVRRMPKIKYWRATGNHAERKAMERRCGWPSLDWRVVVPPVPEVASLGSLA